MCLNTGFLAHTSVGKLVFPFQYKYLPEIGRVFAPNIKVGLKTIDGVIEYDFLVDTGSDLTTLPFFMAKKLQVNLAKAGASNTQGIGGHVVKTWLIKLQLIFPDNNFTVRASITNENSTPFLLGRVDFLDVVCGWNFDAKDKKIKFEKL